ncbi:uroporphyrinogen-III C-methyltransferase [Lichenihabitans sp. PAMC28606]|uniref:uroporphyrinogen-III C-methyltransferase n=1 Tax=Lichenihabitans sp. PAMC28606 TaxID=2880932 RepID=UPI001D0B9ED0|nr:uroporphyrinogen-III C-methyltransferase [Lichenihabitans sp. PAMC28606]UDL94989.1 uroporphyrinogen-III C-methyltransferase [Lichenihabitans sp. PAMC28606]
MSDFSFANALADLSLPCLEPGTVWLVGAGPGDPGLLTLHALNGLRQADVVVYDALVGDVVLGFARPDALREFAGKRGGLPSPKQRDISKRLIELALAGHRVLRLKGGDPFVFGRGGEEALALAAAGIPFRVVPGITAGIGGLAYAAIPATTRDTNRAVILATGHSAGGAVDTNDWAALARTGLPIILYMGMTFLDGIAAGLIEGGLSPETPVAIVTDATSARQRILITTLQRAKVDARERGLGAPAIVAIGDIVRLHDVLAPYAITLEDLA